ncbi:hypothetical protein HK405_008144, partial [Cladochytrium tenue]
MFLLDDFGDARMDDRTTPDVSNHTDDSGRQSRPPHSPRRQIAGFSIDTVPTHRREYPSRVPSATQPPTRNLDIDADDSQRFHSLPYHLDLADFGNWLSSSAPAHTVEDRLMQPELGLPSSFNFGRHRHHQRWDFQVQAANNLAKKLDFLPAGEWDAKHFDPKSLTNANLEDSMFEDPMADPMADAFISGAVSGTMDGANLDPTDDAFWFPSSISNLIQQESTDGSSQNDFPHAIADFADVADAQRGPKSALARMVAESGAVRELQNRPAATAAAAEPQISADDGIFGRWNASSSWVKEKQNNFSSTNELYGTVLAAPKKTEVNPLHIGGVRTIQMSSALPESVLRFPPSSTRDDAEEAALDPAKSSESAYSSGRSDTDDYEPGLQDDGDVFDYEDDDGDELDQDEEYEDKRSNRVPLGRPSTVAIKREYYPVDQALASSAPSAIHQPNSTSEALSASHPSRPSSHKPLPPVSTAASGARPIHRASQNIAVETPGDRLLRTRHSGSVPSSAAAAVAGPSRANPLYSSSVPSSRGAASASVAAEHDRTPRGRRPSGLAHPPPPQSPDDDAAGAESPMLDGDGGLASSPGGHFLCPIEGCGKHFARKFNLK